MLFFIVVSIVVMIEPVSGTEVKGTEIKTEGQFLDPFTMTMRPRALVLKQNYRNFTPMIKRSTGINPRLFMRRNRRVNYVYIPRRPVPRSVCRPCYCR